MSIQLASVESEYEKHIDLKKKDVVALKEWLQKQPHLPQITELEIIFFLRSCVYSIEQTKTTIDNYFTIKTLCPEIFGKRDPVKFGDILDTVANIPLPKLTPEGYQIFYTKMINSNPNKFIFLDHLKYIDVATKLWLMQRGTVEGLIIIMDMDGFSLGHLTRIPIMTVKKFFYFLQEALPLCIKSIHYINAVPFMDKVLGLLKPFMKKELLSLLHVHSESINTLYEYVPQDCLPKDFGGSVDSIADLHTAVKKMILENPDVIRQDEEGMVDESKRPGKQITAQTLFGIEGSFKKLDID